MQNKLQCTRGDINMPPARQTSDVRRHTDA